jgi:NADPH2:quinone reductase
VLATVSSPAKAQLAAAAGADHVTDYRREDVVAEVRRIAPAGVDTVVEVSAAVNAEIDVQVIGAHGAVSMYADDGGAQVTVPVRAQMIQNARWQFVYVYTDAHQAVEDGAVGKVLIDVTA